MNFTDNNEMEMHTDSALPEILTDIFKVEEKIPKITQETEGAEKNPVDLWIEKSPELRSKEIEFLTSSDMGHRITITNAGNLQQPITVGEWTYLMVYDKSFPELTERGEFPIKIYLVTPSNKEFKDKYSTNLSQVPCVRFDNLNIPYLFFKESPKLLKQYKKGKRLQTMAESILCRVTHWTKNMRRQIEKNIILVQSAGDSESAYKNDSTHTVSFDTRSKYIDGRVSRGNNPNPRCKRVVLSDRGLVQVVTETASRIKTETGGLFLGHYENGVWNIVEASDAGANGVFEVAYHETDEVYQNRVCEVISRNYKYPLIFLGMWHRHPGSLDTFSATDDMTHIRQLRSMPHGYISALVNYDPYFRITFYYVEPDKHTGVRYTKLDFEVGDEKITNKEMMSLKDLSDLKCRMKGVAGYAG